MEKLRQLNQLWFVAFQTPGGRRLKMVMPMKGEVKRKSRGGVEKELTRLHDFIQFVGSFIGSFIFCCFIHASDMNKCLLCLRYCDRHFGQNSSQDMVPHYRKQVGLRTLRRKH